MAWPSPSQTRWINGPRRAIKEDGLSFAVQFVACQVPEHPGSSATGQLNWGRGEAPVAVIAFRVHRLTADRASLRLQFQVDREPVDQTIELQRRPCNLGGGRWFAICPQTGRSAAKLYLMPGRRLFLSRRAQGFGYRTQCATPADRAMLKRDRIARRLGINVAAPRRPKWVRARTYENAMAVFRAYDHIWIEECNRLFGFGR